MSHMAKIKEKIILGRSFVTFDCQVAILKNLKFLNYKAN
jgi:hypothetical protein